MRAAATRRVARRTRAPPSASRSLGRSLRRRLGAPELHALAPERAEAKQLLHSFTTADTEGDAFLKERQSAQEAMGVPLGTDGTPLAWARVQVLLPPPPLSACPPIQPIAPAGAHAPSRCRIRQATGQQSWPL